MFKAKFQNIFIKKWRKKKSFPLIPTYLTHSQPSLKCTWQVIQSWPHFVNAKFLWHLVLMNFINLSWSYVSWRWFSLLHAEHPFVVFSRGQWIENLNDMQRSIFDSATKSVSFLRFGWGSISLGFINRWINAHCLHGCKNI